MVEIEAGKNGESENLFVRATRLNFFDQFHRALAALQNGDKTEAHRQIGLATESIDLYFNNRCLEGLTDDESAEYRRLSALAEDMSLKKGRKLTEGESRRYHELHDKWFSAEMDSLLKEHGTTS